MWIMEHSRWSADKQINEWMDDDKQLHAIKIKKKKNKKKKTSENNKKLFQINTHTSLHPS